MNREERKQFVYDPRKIARAAREMQDYITALAEKHGVSLSRQKESLRLELAPHLPLTARKIAKNLIAVQQDIKVDGHSHDRCVVFFIGYGEWVPVSETYRGNYFRRATLTDDSRELYTVDKRWQPVMADHCRQWAEELQAQGWLENARRRNH